MPSDDRDEGGDPVCWLHLVCEECGIVSDTPHPHRPEERARFTPAPVSDDTSDDE